VLELLKSVISEFPKSALKSTCELILGLLGIHNTVSAFAASDEVVSSDRDMLSLLESGLLSCVVVFRVCY